MNVKAITDENMSERGNKLKLLRKRFIPIIYADFDQLVIKDRLGRKVDQERIDWSAKLADFYGKVKFNESLWELFQEEYLQYFPLDDIPSPKISKLEALQALYKRFNHKSYRFCYSRRDTPRNPFKPIIQLMKPNEKIVKPPSTLRFEITLEWRIKA